MYAAPIDTQSHEISVYRKFEEKKVGNTQDRVRETKRTRARGEEREKERKETERKQDIDKERVREKERATET